MPQYLFLHALRPLQRLIIPEAQYPKAFGFQISSSLRVVDSLIDMLSTIQFHDQFLFDADKVDDVRRNRMLSPELESTEVAVL